MSDDPAPSPYTDAKAKLEVEQLELQNEQLKNDIKRAANQKWSGFWSWASTSGTILATLVVAGIGWHYQSSISNETQRDQMYITTLTTLVSKDSAVRQGAIPMLASFVEAPKDAPALESLAMISNRLTAETDEGVLREIIWVSGQLPAEAIPTFVRSNRFTAVQFGRALGDYIAAEQLVKKAYVGRDVDGNPTVDEQNTPHNRRVDNAILDGLGRQLDDIPVPQEAELATSSELSNFNLDDVLQVKSVQDMCEKEEVLQRDTLRPKDAAASAEKAYGQVIADARAFASASSALLELLRTNRSHLAGVDLSQIAILYGDMNDFDFSKADLHGAFLGGPAAGINFSHTDLDGASIAKLTIDQSAVFDGTSVSGLHIGDAKFKGGGYLPIASDDPRLADVYGIALLNIKDGDTFDTFYSYSRSSGQRAVTEPPQLRLACGEGVAPPLVVGAPSKKKKLHPSVGFMEIPKLNKKKPR